MWKWWPELLIVSAIVVGVTLLCLTPVRDGVAEIGFMEVPMAVKIVDKNTQRTIANASIRILGCEGELADGHAADKTKEDGQVKLIPLLTFSSRKENFTRNGGVRFWDKKIEVKADGYAPVQDELSAYAGLGLQFSDLPPPTITIELMREKIAKE